MTEFLARLNVPLFVLDRRHFFNRHLRDMFRRQGVDAQVAGQTDPEPFPMTESTERFEHLTVIGFFRLVGIVGTALLLFIGPLLLIINGRTDRQIDSATASVLKESDTRYVTSQLYAIRHDELSRAVQEMKVRTDSAETQRAKMELQLAQIQMTLESVRVNQQQKGAR